MWRPGKTRQWATLLALTTMLGCTSFKERPDEGPAWVDSNEPVYRSQAPESPLPNPDLPVELPKPKPLPVSESPTPSAPIPVPIPEPKPIPANDLPIESPGTLPPLPPLNPPKMEEPKFTTSNKPESKNAQTTTPPSLPTPLLPPEPPVSPKPIQPVTPMPTPTGGDLPIAVPSVEPTTIEPKAVESTVVKPVTKAEPIELPNMGSSITPVNATASPVAKPTMQPLAPEGPLPPVDIELTPSPKPTTDPSANALSVSTTSKAPPADITPKSLLGRTTQIQLVATIGSDIYITDREIWQMVLQRGQEYMNLTGPVREEKEKKIFREELKRVIGRELIIQDLFARLKKNNKGDLIPELMAEGGRQADEHMRSLQDYFKLGSLDELKRIMESQGIDFEMFRRGLERQAMTGVYLREFVKDKDREIGPAQIIDYYRKNPDEFRIEDRVKWLDLFVSLNRFDSPAAAKQAVEKLHQQLKAGKDFVELVKSSGHGDSVLRDGEGIGSKRGEIRPTELEPTLFKLQVDEVSNIIPTSTGYHIVKVIERDTAGIQPLDQKTQSKIRSKLYQKIMEEEQERVIHELWRKNSVTVMNLP